MQLTWRSTRLGSTAALVAVSVALTASSVEQDVAPSVRYLGQPPPGTTPVRFAPGIVSTDAVEINGVFRPDFREFFFARRIGDVFSLFRSTLTGSAWTAQEPLPVFPGGATGLAVDVAYSPDGADIGVRPSSSRGPTRRLCARVWHGWRKA